MIHANLLTFVALCFSCAIFGLFIGILFAKRESDKDSVYYQDWLMVYKDRLLKSNKAQDRLIADLENELIKVSEDINKPRPLDVGVSFKKGYQLAVLMILEKLRGY